MARTAPGRGTFAARLGAITQVLFGGILGIVASFGFEPGFLPRGLVLFALFAIPGLVGWLGVERGRPALVVAAGLTSFVGAFVAFSGVTLIFLIPALLLIAGAVRMQLTVPAKGGASILPALGRGLAAGAIVAMLVGGGAAALLLTDDACWVEYPAGSGARIQRLPYSTGEMTVPPGAASMSCSTGVISGRGVGLAALLSTGALILAERSSRRRHPGLHGS